MNNYHSHTTFCDGANTAEEMVLKAIELGMGEIGFSGHSYLPFDDEWTMNPEEAKQYRETIKSLRDAYAERISVRLGIEQDYCSPTDELSEYEYVIGGVHCLFKDDYYISVDLDRETQEKGIKEAYGGDVYAFVDDYFDTVADIYNKTKCDIIAHFDLLSKYVEKGSVINPDNERYKAAEDRAIEALLKTPAVFEVNTGAMSRGYRTEPYPSLRILKKLADAKAPVILSSDTHSVETIDYGMETAAKVCKDLGLTIIESIDELIKAK